ncbi:class I SAM-dependent methyltransferase [Cupriavidus sp. H18C2]
MNQANEAQAVFTEIYHRNQWGSPESVSGSGSEMTRTRHLRTELPHLLREFNIRSVLDIPCGDFNWMRHVDLGGVHYIGADIVPELVEHNRRTYRGPRIQFEHLDVIASPLPKVDAVLCRDGLVHFPHASIAAALRNICSSGALYLLTTHFSFRTPSANEEIDFGQWRRLNFELAPFHWPAPRRYIIEGCDEHDGHFADKSLAIWPVQEIRSRLQWP